MKRGFRGDDVLGFGLRSALKMETCLSEMLVSTDEFTRPRDWEQCRLPHPVISLAYDLYLSCFLPSSQSVFGRVWCIIHSVYLFLIVVLLKLDGRCQETSGDHLRREWARRQSWHLFTVVGFRRKNWGSPRKTSVGSRPDCGMRFRILQLCWTSTVSQSIFNIQDVSAVLSPGYITDGHVVMRCGGINLYYWQQSRADNGTCL